MVKRCTIHRKIIHEHFPSVLDEIRESGHHAALKGSEGITQPK